MKVAIVGAGKLGITITEALLGGGYEVTLIDKNGELLEKVSSQLDLLTVNANAKNINILQEIKVHTYDYFVAVTNDDEKNIVICSFAKKLGCPNVIARVRDPEHVNQMEFIKEAMGINYVVNPDKSVSNEIYKYLVEKYSLTNGYFSTGKVAIVEFNSEKLPIIIGKSIAAVDKMLDNMIVVAISRNGKFIIPKNEMLLEDDDSLYVIGDIDPVTKLSAIVHEKDPYTDLQRVMIAGGGKTGFYLAEKLSEFGVSVKIIEINKNRCQYLSEHLNDVMVLHGDATDQTLLEEEHIDEMDAFVTVTGYDEENLLLALMANQRNIEDVVAKVSRRNYVDLIEKMGISMALNPLDMTAASILRYIQGSKRIVSSQLIQGQAEFIEVIANKNMRMIDIPISQLKIPEGVIIAALHREDEVIIPKGDTVIHEGDKVFIFCHLSSISNLEKLFQARKWNFFN